MVKIKSFRVYFLSSFMRKVSFRLGVFLLAIILCFNTICKPKDTEAASILAGLTLTEILAIIGTAATCTFGGIAAADTIKGWFEKNEPNIDPVEYFNKEITVDGDGNYVISDAGMVTINAMKESYEEDMTYWDGYIPTKGNIDPSTFSTKTGYDFVCKMMDTNPEYFYNIYFAGTSNGASEYLIYIYEPISYFVSANKSTTTATAYNYDWSASLRYYCYKLVCDPKGNTTLLGMNCPSGFEAITSPDDWTGVHVEDSQWHMGVNMYVYSYWCGQKIVATSPLWVNVFHQTTECFPVFKSEDAMRRGTANGVKGQFLTPEHIEQIGPITNNTVTKDQINTYNNIVNNYYGGGSGGSGSGDNNGGSSSGGFFGGLLDALGKFGDVILGILTKLLEFLTKGIQLVVDSFSKVADLVDNGFVDLLTAVFPYLPEEWITVINVGFGLLLFGVIIRIFTK